MNMKKVTKKKPMRKCVGCQEMKDKQDMIRVLRTESGEIILDTTGKKNGRGAYLCFTQECMDKAIKNKGLERSFKRAMPQEVYDDLKKELSEIESK